MRICIDTVIFIDILKDEYRGTQEKFYRALRHNNTLMASVVTVAELLPQFRGNRKQLWAFLQDHRIQVVDLDLQSSLFAAERWLKYLKKRKSKHCPSCRSPIPGRDSLLADFFIGGFALTHCSRILARDLTLINWS